VTSDMSLMPEVLGVVPGVRGARGIVRMDIGTRIPTGRCSEGGYRCEGLDIFVPSARAPGGRRGGDGDSMVEVFGVSVAEGYSA
jgi:hypothetical protein